MDDLFDDMLKSGPVNHGRHLQIVGSSRNDGPRADADFYPTPRIAITSLLNQEKFNGNIFEPACGAGHISKVLKEYNYTVISSDLVNRGYGDFFETFLTCNKRFDNIVTNPPFNLALEFINRAKTVSKEKIAFLLKTTFLESKERYYMFQDKIFPLSKVYQFSNRIRMGKGINDDGGSGGMIAFAWFIWDKNHIGSPTIHWIL